MRGPLWGLLIRVEAGVGLLCIKYIAKFRMVLCNMIRSLI
jgi:hypothetical protein